MLTKEEQKKWAWAISMRVADEWSGRSDDAETAMLLQTVIEKALLAVQDEMEKLIGTGVIEADYFN
jgi:hypothetical protein